MSNYDAWYLDCGFGAWVGDGNNWYSPYKGWQAVYDNSPHKIVGDLAGAQYTSQVTDDLMRTVVVDGLPPLVGRVPVVTVADPGTKATVQIPSVVVTHDDVKASLTSSAMRGSLPVAQIWMMYRLLSRYCPTRPSSVK
ncbi:uncharacterized protein LOC143027517 [Oratosquilla oratoria]|uniref:uncharacterized protein LOC143027517 n=1 Tax=Oratosquilla oratoria TaxID=337810 RepID=UPI003F760B94